MYSYEGLRNKLSERQMTISALTGMLGISSRTIAKINRNEKVSAAVRKKLGEFFSCPAEELFQEYSDNKLLRILREEKDAKISGGIYHELQIRMTYNSNHIEGSRLTEDQTRMIFETNTIDAGDGIPVDDVLETVHHFRGIDFCIDIAEETLTEEQIKKLHYIIKHDTKDASLEWFAVGDYKRRPNAVGGHETAKPGEVADKMRKLLTSYNAKPDITIRDIIAFHAAFEAIHPFQDGNGRVGRLIALKECLRHNVIPFIIEDSKKAYYYRGLSRWNTDKGYLIDTCLDGQDTFSDLMKYFEISEKETGH